MSTPQSAQERVTVARSPGTLSFDKHHQHRRRFIGPLPERIMARMTDPALHTPQSHTGAPRLHRRDSASEEDSEAGVHAAIREHALQFFLGHGGRREDWGESQERSVREDMYRRWTQSEWGQAHARKREAKHNSQWIGTSFDIGVFLGVDMMGKGHSSMEQQEPGTPVASMSRAATPGVASTAAETYVTAPSTLPEEGPSSGYFSTHLTGKADSSADSTTPLLEEPPEIMVNGVPWNSSSGSGASSSRAIRNTNTSSTTPPSKGKGKMVHYVDGTPAPPHEVLGRTGSDVVDTSAGAAWQATVENQVNWGDVIMRDRMLVQVSFTNNESLGSNFDETQNRITSCLQYEDWAEYIVAWRKDRLELYTDYSIPFKEWFAGHKRLAFVVPLSDNNTKLSLYSFTEFTFCITCPPKPIRTRSGKTSHWLVYGTTKGTNIFIFNVKPRTRAIDWMWHLWRHLGGQLPPSIEILCPTIDTHLRIVIPGYDKGDIEEAFAVFTPGNTINLCKNVMRTVSDWYEVITRAEKQGTPLALAWRMDAKLDWVWQTDDIEGKFRNWAVLHGLALKQGKQPAHLELRLQQHRPTRIRLKDGTRLDEPPGLEGYVDRIRPASQLRHAMYLTTHDGYLFFLSAPQALPPTPPGLPRNSDDPSDFRNSEVFRGAQQILRATGLTDLRSIAAVRRAFQFVPMQTDRVPDPASSPWEDTEAFWAQTEPYEDDEDDVGGEEGLSHSPDRPTRRLRRSFELLLTSGRVVRFEAYSCQHALEWIARLRPLVSYWKKRHQADAKLEMDLSHASTGRPRVTPLRHVHDKEDAFPEGPPNPDESSPDLSSIYNWCVLLGCRPINRCGRLFSRGGLRGQYKHVLLILLSGHLVEFNITPTSLYHRRATLIPLLDAYVCSGYFAAQHLPEGQYNPDSPPLPRRYQDGLESDDRDDDTLFMIWWYRGSGPESTDAAKSNVPPLSAKRHVAVFRTRSKLERDVWVWAIKSEIENVVRAAKDRETLVRNAGELLKT